MSHQYSRVDPESREVLEQHMRLVPGGVNAIADPVARREASDALSAAGIEAAGGPDQRVGREDLVVPGLDGDPDVPVRVYRPADAAGPLPGIFFIHGGGMMMGSVAGEDSTAAVYSLAAGAVLVSGGYRLAPEYPHPAQSRDTYAGFSWMMDNAEALGIDPSRVAIVGGSAGGNLALVTAMRARDDGRPSPQLVLAAYPMLDPTNTTASSHAVTELGMWDRGTNIEAWQWFLGGAEPDRYASPLLETDWAGFGPVFMDVGTEDAFRDEDLALVAAMVKQGVFVEFHLYPGAYHASEALAPEAELSRRITATRLSAVRRALA
ncbi:alpha/beta hydrolase [Tessaracoccus sp. ZS01]|uniref:alpha/beta hydrolase n=1 Tax=Tessaracoccus sp. ZS01 TaxID=1906324 RepID=UPI00096E3A4B|nr:alpha/beta hydrolase [Tessaracoccus sp. ZS01]MCG6568277.1 alpha/beta hydrolase [Tessaracoccus sp. ZS01]OMG53368.1 hypothetical protein BJN44_11710 [Tessaracoccus sp. ZS01]